MGTFLFYYKYRILLKCLHVIDGNIYYSAFLENNKCIKLKYVPNAEKY